MEGGVWEVVGGGRGGYARAMLGLGPVDWLIVAVVVVTAVQLVIEARKKRWGAVMVSVLFLGLFVWIGWGIWTHLWGMVVGSGGQSP